MTPIEEVFNLMYGLITDTDLAKLSNEDLKDLSITFLKHTIVKFKECKADLTIEEDDSGDEDTFAPAIGVSNTSSGASVYSQLKTHAFSVRCVKLEE